MESRPPASGAALVGAALTLIGAGTAVSAAFGRASPMFEGSPVSAWSVGDWVFAVTLAFGVPLLLWALYEWCAPVLVACPQCGRTVRADSMIEIIPRGVLGADPIKACASCLGDHANELELCPVCERTVRRGEMQRAYVKQQTKPGQSQRNVKQLVCDDCIGSGERPVAGARAQRTTDGPA